MVIIQSDGNIHWVKPQVEMEMTSHYNSMRETTFLYCLFTNDVHAFCSSPSIESRRDFICSLIEYSRNKYMDGVFHYPNFPLIVALFRTTVGYFPFFDSVWYSSLSSIFLLFLCALFAFSLSSSLVLLYLFWSNSLSRLSSLFSSRKTKKKNQLRTPQRSLSL